jgi:hypothetical protein
MFAIKIHSVFRAKKYVPIVYTLIMLYKQNKHYGDEKGALLFLYGAYCN